jgi:roadblock/LC7 domain-containing protein
MAWTTDHLAALEEAIASGELSVRYGDRMITYQSLREMRSLRAEMKAEIAAAAGRPRKRVFRLHQSGQGL